MFCRIPINDLKILWEMASARAFSSIFCCFAVFALFMFCSLLHFCTNSWNPSVFCIVVFLYFCIFAFLLFCILHFLFLQNLKSVTLKWLKFEYFVLLYLLKTFYMFCTLFRQSLQTSMQILEALAQKMSMLYSI